MKTLMYALTLLLGVFSCQSNASQENKSTTNDTAQTSTAQAISNTEKMDKYLGVKVGDKAPAFELKGVDDQLYSFENIKDANGETPKGFVVTFTCNTCPYAVGYEDRLIDLHNKLSPMGYPLVAIQTNDPELKPGDSFDEMKKRHAEKGFPFIYLNDDGQKVYPQYGAKKTPEIYLVDGDQIVRYHGAIDDNAQHPNAVTINYVENAVAAIEAGQNPDPADVKAIGCSIKAKKI